MGEVIPFPLPAARPAAAVPRAEEATPSARSSLVLLVLSMLLLAVLVRR